MDAANTFANADIHGFKREDAVPKLAPMAKKKVSGEHSTPRWSVQIPAEWGRIARRLASKTRQPANWYVLSLLYEAAKAENEADPENAQELPPLPWDAENPDAEE